MFSTYVLVVAFNFFPFGLASPPIAAPVMVRILRNFYVDKKDAPKGSRLPVVTEEVYRTSIDSSLPDHLNITSVVVMEQPLKFLQRGIIKDLPNLHTIAFIQTEISTIEDGAFSNLPSLNRVEILSSEVEALPKHVFNNFSIETLHFGAGKLSRIEPGALADLPKLKNLNLRGNKLKQWDPSWFSQETQNLRWLDLGNNLISKIPAGSFEDFPHLVEVRLSGNPLEEIEEDAFKGLQLSLLDLSHTRVEKLHPSIAKAFDSNRTTRAVFEEPHVNILEDDAIVNLLVLTSAKVTCADLEMVEEEAKKSNLRFSFDSDHCWESMTNLNSVK